MRAMCARYLQPLRSALPLLVAGLLQMTITTPWRRMVLHFSQIFLTDGLTFMSLPTCTGR